MGEAPLSYRWHCCLASTPHLKTGHPPHITPHTYTPHSQPGRHSPLLLLTSFCHTRPPPAVPHCAPSRGPPCHTSLCMDFELLTTSSGLLSSRRIKITAGRM